MSSSHYNAHHNTITLKTTTNTVKRRGEQRHLIEGSQLLHPKSTANEMHMMGSTVTISVITTTSIDIATFICSEIVDMLVSWIMVRGLKL